MLPYNESGFDSLKTALYPFAAALDFRKFVRNFDGICCTRSERR
jgi:hypothetical protein